jgi:hypothetical protein
MRQLLKRVPRGRAVLSVLVALSCALLVLGIAVKGWGQGWGQDEHAPNPLNIATRDDPEPNNGFGGGADVQELEPKLPADLNVFNLTLEQTRQYSVRSHYEVVGHSYFKGPWLTPSAVANGQGGGFNTPRVYNGFGYFGGYPPTVFGILIADVRDPQDMKPLSFIPCNPGTRCPYLRVDPIKHILVYGNDTNATNPTQPPAGTKANSGLSFYDISDPAHPKLLSFLKTADGRATHGLTLDGRYAYACAEVPESKLPENALDHDMLIVDYQDPTHPVLVYDFHVVGQHTGETFAPQNQLNPDGTAQLPYCHEVNYYQNRVYLAYRDAGQIILDVTDRSHPVQLMDYDYVPPYNGGGLGATHTFIPVGYKDFESAPPLTTPPTIAISTDENFSCPPGFGRVMDISSLGDGTTNVTGYPALLATYRIPIADDNYDPATGMFTCPAGQQTSHHPWFDYRSASLLHQAWYTQGLRAWNLSNPYTPQEIGYYISPNYYATAAGEAGRATREVWQDETNGLIWITDGNGGGVTALRWTGAIPPHPPLPGAR